MSQPLRILLIDDNPNDRALAIRELKREFSALAVDEILEAVGFNQALKAGQFDVVVTDYQLGWSTGLKILRAVKASHPNCPVVMFTNTGSEEIAVEAMKAGLDDYIIKLPKYFIRLRAAVRSAFIRSQESQRAAHLENRLQELLNRLNVGVFRSTLDGKLLESNPAFLRLLGMNSLSDTQNVSLPAVFLQAEDPSVPNSWEEAVQFRRTDGSTIWVLLNKAFSTIGGESFIEGLVENITLRKQVEEERDQLLTREQQARAEAETANRIKDEFLATLSHELRTPLNPMLGWVQLLRRGRLDAATTARALETIERNVKTQAKLIEDLLDVSRIIAGKLCLDVRVVHLATIVEAAIETVRIAAEAKGIRIEATLDRLLELPSGDPNRLQQVVWNLLSNAVKFTPGEGRIEVRLERAYSRAQILVKDTGIGISAEFLPYVFDRFQQANSSTTRTYGGLGLGLAIVRHLVELHGGTVQAESPGPGQGATFIVQLPIAAVGQQLRSLEQEDSTNRDDVAFQSVPTLEGLRVLVVDDEADARELLIIALEQYGAQVTAALSASEALAVLKQLKPDVLVSDIGMPYEDGYVLIRQVRALAPEQGGQTPAVALTAYAREEERAQALASGFQFHVAKPVEPNELARIVANLAGRTNSL